MITVSYYPYETDLIDDHVLFSIQLRFARNFCRNRYLKSDAPVQTGSLIYNSIIFAIKLQKAAFFPNMQVLNSTQCQWSTFAF